MPGARSKATGRLIRAVAVAVAVAALLATASAGAGPPSKRIVGGTVANPADWPWIAALMAGGDDPDNRICGATVIARRAALTAAHCVTGPNPPLSIVIDRPDLSIDTGTVIHVKRAIPHPRFKRVSFDDFAVLRLRRATPGPYADLPTAKQARAATAVGKRSRVAGWGSTAPNGSAPSEILMETDQRVVRRQACVRAFSAYEFASEICTRGPRIPGTTHRTSPCYGDSGGPLVADTGGGELLVGVVSHGGARCGVSKPGVYARVAHALGFIKNNAGL
jgi:secreted trypsin-like serine protease